MTCPPGAVHVAEARRLAGLGATIARSLAEEELDHYGVAMSDPGGNELDINELSAALGHLSDPGVPWGAAVIISVCCAGP